MTLLSARQRQIYNLHLKSFRLNNNQPFRAKKDFSDIEKSDEKVLSLQKIEKVFNSYPAFFDKMYFDAPYKIYKDEAKFYPLKFYASQKGITTCIAYYKILMESDPEEQFDIFKESYKFVANFCISKNITLNNYVKYCSISQNDCLLHLKSHKISWYLIFSIPNFYELLYSLPYDEFQLYYGSDVDLGALYNRYNSSFKTQKFLSNVKTTVSQFIQKRVAQS